MESKKRTYVLRARGERQAETRRRIAQATMELHQEVGPRHTTVSAIAERAGVERLTVYRHFPDEDALFAACSARFSELNPPPDRAAWRTVADVPSRTRKALESLYGYYRGTAPMLRQLFRDAGEIPALAHAMQPFLGYLAELAADLGAPWGDNDGLIRAVCHHAVEFSTWASLEAGGVGDAEKAALVLLWLGALARPRLTQAHETRSVPPL